MSQISLQTLLKKTSQIMQLQTTYSSQKKTILKLNSVFFYYSFKKKNLILVCIFPAQGKTKGLENVPSVQKITARASSSH